MSWWSLYWNNSEMILTYLPTYVYKLWSHPWMGSFHLNKIEYTCMVHVHIQDVFVKVLPMTFLFLTYFPIWKLLLEPWQHHEFVFAPKRFNTCSGPLGQHEWLLELQIHWLRMLQFLKRSKKLTLCSLVAYILL